MDDYVRDENNINCSTSIIGSFPSPFHENEPHQCTNSNNVAYVPVYQNSPLVISEYDDLVFDITKSLLQHMLYLHQFLIM